MQNTGDYRRSFVGYPTEPHGLLQEGGIEWLKAIEAAARVYYINYCQDEAAELESCIHPKQHAEAQALRDALQYPISHRSSKSMPEEEVVSDEKMKVWIVVRQNTEGKQEIAQAFFNEDNARYAASQLVGVGTDWVVMRTIDLEDRPREARS